MQARLTPPPGRSGDLVQVFPAGWSQHLKDTEPCGSLILLPWAGPKTEPCGSIILLPWAGPKTTLWFNNSVALGGPKDRTLWFFNSVALGGPKDRTLWFNSDGACVEAVEISCRR